MADCPWCMDLVDEEGDCCSYGCYTSYFAWLFALNNGSNDDLVKLQPDDRPPKPLYLQPWYSWMAGLEDYLGVPDSTTEHTTE